MIFMNICVTTSKKDLKLAAGVEMHLEHLENTNLKQLYFIKITMSYSKTR